MTAYEYIANQELQRLLHDFFKYPVKKRKYMDKLRIVNHIHMMMEYRIKISRITRNFIMKNLERDKQFLLSEDIKETELPNRKEYAYVVDLDSILRSGDSLLRQL